MTRLSTTLTVILLIQSSQLFAQQAPSAAACDSALLKLASPVNGYQARNDRCEGVYARQVSSTPLFLASFTSFYEDYDLHSTEPLGVSWPAQPDSAFHLRAETIHRGRYYRMDAMRPAGDSTFRWPTRVLTAEAIPKRDLGVIGWTRIKYGGATRMVFVPLRIGQTNRTARCTGYELLLAPGERLSEVYLSLAPVSADGSLGAFVKRDVPLGYGFYPAETAIKVKLAPTEFPTSGMYYLKVAARLAAGGSSSRDYYVFADPGCGKPE